MGLVEKMGELLFPPRCLCCNRVVPSGEECCRECRRKFRQFPPPGEWEGRPVVSLWLYEDDYPVAILRLKFHRDRSAGKRMARLMALQWERQFPRFGADLITFVPMPPERERRRGGNHAELLARWIGEELECPVAPLLQREGILTQHQLPAAMRHRQKAGGMSLLPGAEDLVRGKQVVLVDDLITTGTTVGECAQLLEEAGAERTALLAAARASDRRARTSSAH